MAVIHEATISPTKLELVTTWLDEQTEGAASGEPVELVGGYRFDDPDGEVGVEGLVFQRAGRVHHLALTYRGAPMPGGDDALVTTMEHSALGRRWIYDASRDRVALGCFERALRGEQAQAALEVHASDGTVTHREPAVTVRRVGNDGDGERLQVFSGPLAHGKDSDNIRLVASWDGGQGVVAALT